jgi:serine/threonine-protein kinase PknK
VSATELAEDRLLAGRYRYRGELGRGASGRVFEVEDLDGAARAIKVVDAAAAARSSLEGAALRSVRSPHVAAFFELLRVPEGVGAPFRVPPGAALLVEQRVAGGPVDGATPADRPRYAVEVGLAALEGLAALHGAGLVHGDVKPANLLAPPEAPGRACLVDLGLAGPPRVDAEAGGTLPYLAPEALAGLRSPATDVYALGVTLARILDPEAPLPRPGVPPAVRGAGSTLTRAVEALLASERPPSAAEAHGRLALAAAEVGLPSVPPLPARPTRGVLALPRVGAEAPLRSLLGALAEPGVVALVGAPGSGRGRLLADAVCRLQAAEARPPTFLRAGAAIPRVDGPAVVAFEGDVTAARRAVAAAAIEGHVLRVVLESTEPVDGVDASIVLTPLDASELETLLRRLAGAAPSPALQDAAWRASGGLAGRLCRRWAVLLEEGVDPVKTPERLVEDDASTLPAGPAARRLAVAGEGLDPSELEEHLGELRALRAAGLLFTGRDGRLRLRDDVAEAIYAAEEDRASLARALRGARLGRLGHLLRAAAEGVARPAAARAFVAEARQRGDVAGAERAARRLLSRTPDRGLREALADALRAQGREREGLAVLDATDDPTLRAELHRRLGEAEAAAALLVGLSSPEAAATRARLALDGGRLEEAAAEAGTVAADAPPTARLRAAEVRFFVALGTGEDPGPALRAAQEAGGGDSPRVASLEGTWAQARGRRLEAEAAYRRGLELADRAGERRAAASLVVNGGLIQLEEGRLGPALGALREGARRLVLLGRNADAARALYNLANAAALAGDADRALDALAHLDRLGPHDRTLATYAAVVRADLDLAVGRVDRARQRLDEVADGADRADDVAAIRDARRALLRLAAHDREGAEGLLRAPAVGVEARVEVGLARVRALEAAGAPFEGALAELEGLADEVAPFEARLRVALAAADLHERTSRLDAARLRWARARELLDGAIASLPPEARGRMRAVPAYARALASAPAPAAAAPAQSIDAWAPRLARERRPEGLRERLVDAAIDVSGAERGFWLTRDPAGSIASTVARGLGAGLDVGARPSRSVAARALDRGEAVLSVEATEDDRFDAAASVHRLRLRSVLAAPVPRPDGREEVLYVDDRLRPAAFDAAILKRIADLAALGAALLEGTELLEGAKTRAEALARQGEELEERLERQATELRSLRRPSGMVADSDAMRILLEKADRVAASGAPVVVEGESGTGKELLAQRIHAASPRAEGPFVTENCGAIPEALLESALFGHVRGAFTGAEASRRGLFQLADGGTLLLDEVGEMSPAMQAKLLRVLQEGEVRPVGAEATQRVDVRVLAATHRDLEVEVAEGRFRADLFYRLAVVRLSLPPLRHRVEDIPALVAAFTARHGRPEARFDGAALAALRAFDWPGNVRQLENEVRRALVFAAGDRIGRADLSPALRGEGAGEEDAGDLDLDRRVDALKRELIARALAETQGNRSRAALRLGVSRYGLSKMIKRLGIEDR